MKYVLMILFTLFIFSIGIILGRLLRKKEEFKKSIGDLRIDMSDPDGPYLFLELKTNPNMLIKMDYVVMKVNVKNFISQK